MTDLTRRHVLASSAGLAALGLTGSLAFTTTALAASVRDKGFYSYKIGDIEVISIYDGIWEKPHADNFIVGATVEETKAALREGGLTDEFVPIEFAFTVVKTGDRTILIDSGTGAQLAPTAGKGAAGMAAAGISAGDIDTVLISHFHPDHIFGLMAKDTNAQVFPEAEIMVSENEFKFWTDPAILETLPERRRGLAQRIQATFPSWKNVSKFTGDTEVAPGIRTVNTFGHTPGHTAFHISSGDDQLMLLGDLMNLPALFLANLDWQLVFDGDKDAASATRKAVVKRVVAEDIAVAGYHFGFPNSGKIAKDGSGFVFNPVSA